MKKRQVLLMLGAGIVLTMAGIVSSCEEKEAPKPEPVATSIQIVSGSSQAANVNSALTNPIEVLVKDQDGNAFKGAKVTFSVTQGSVSSSSSTTDASGKAKVRWTLGSKAGVQTLTIKGFKADGKSGLSGSPLTVNATATEKVAASIELVSGGDQTGDVETTLNDPVIFLVKDNNGDPFAGATVKFAVAEGSLSSVSETTDANGNVSVSWTLGATVGTQALTVTSFKADGITDLSGSPLSVNAVAVGMEAASIELVSGGSQTGYVNDALADSVKVLVKDQNGNPFGGVTVNFEVTEGSVSSSSKTTDANGYASVKWTLGPTEGTQTLTITAFKADGTTPLAGSPISVHVEAEEVYVATTIKLVSGGDQTSAAGTTLNEIKIVVYDQNNRGFRGETVSFTVDEGSVNPATAKTDANGEVRIYWTLGSTVGTQTLTVTAFESDGVTHLAGSPITINATATEMGGSSDDITDYDGNTYKTVIIGTQTWMAENLKVTHYPNGDAISLVTDNTAWGNLGDNDTDDAYCFYNNNANGEADIYGALYTYAAAKDACPDGWHLPTVTDWNKLTDLLGTGYPSCEVHLARF